MSTDIHWFEGDTLVANHLKADANGPALNLIRLNPGERHQATLFMTPTFAKALRDALDTLYPPSESDDVVVERYADEHAGEFEVSTPPLRFALMESATHAFNIAHAMNSAYLAGMRAGGAQ